MQIINMLFLLGFTAHGALAAIGSSCSASLGSGTCQKTSSCAGFTVVGACPSDPTDVRCCIQKACSPPSGSGKCKSVSSGCSGTFIAGYCPGDSSIQCCVATVTPPTGTGAKVLAAAKTQKGVPYSWGGGGCYGKSRGIKQGSNTVGFDCSGLTQYAVCQATGYKKTIGRTTQYQYGSGTRVPRSQAKPGDLIFWGTGGDCSCSGGYCKSISHVAIWIGNGNIWEAQKTGTTIGEYPMRLTNACPYAVRYW